MAALSDSAVPWAVGVRREPRSSRERRSGRAGASVVSGVAAGSGAAGAGAGAGAGEAAGTAAASAAAERRGRRAGRASRAGAGSVSSPEPKSSSDSGAGAVAPVAESGVGSAVRRRRVGVRGSSADSERAAARRRGRGLVPSESERLVGICGLNPIMHWPAESAAGSVGCSAEACRTEDRMRRFHWGNQSRDRSLRVRLERIHRTVRAE
jgi:hypothetical protein